MSPNRAIPADKSIRSSPLAAAQLLTSQSFFKALKKQWVATGMEEQAMCVRVAKRFCRIAYQMVAGGQVFRHPSCQKRDYILRKLSIFHAEHGSSMAQVMTDLQAATNHIPKSEHAPEAKSLYEELQPSNRRQQSGPRSAGRDPARSLGQAGGECCRLEFEGGERPHVTARAEEPKQRLVAPWLSKPKPLPEAWRSVGSPTPDTAAWGHSPDVRVWRDVIHCLRQKWLAGPGRFLIKCIP